MTGIQLPQNSAPVTLPSSLAVTSQPAVTTQASASAAASASGLRHLCCGATVNLEAVAAQTDVIVNLRDGATGAGTVLWSIRIAVPAGTAFAQFFPLPNIAGSTNTAMTLEFAAAPVATNFESVTLHYFDSL